MADHVAVMDEEYTTLKDKLTTLHQGYLDQVKGILEKIQVMNDKGGVFYAVVLSPKIEALVGELETVKSSMETVFEANEEIIESFKTVVGDYDSMS
jgi:hypothetical protein